jgi:lipoprotein-anchoring transpeptidase ErfK/SrfK
MARFTLRAIVWLTLLVGARAEEYPRPVQTLLEAQVELHRRGFSCGSIDGVFGAQTEAALRALQRAFGIAESGALDEPTKAVLILQTPALRDYSIAPVDLQEVRPLPETWLGKSKEPTLAFASTLELLAERFRANPKWVQRVNPHVDWSAPEVGMVVQVPSIDQAVVARGAAAIHVKLAARELEVVDDIGGVVAHFPVSIARRVEKRPVGELKITVVVRDPNYTFDPVVFPESAEAKELGRKLILPPGPNNPVGRAWIGLDKPGYGIHGTPDPEKVGRTESHGCFRLANWDAITLLGLVRVGMIVWVDE